MYDRRKHTQQPTPLPKRYRVRLVGALFTILSCINLAQAASTSPALPTAVLTHGYDAAGPELRRSAEPADPRIEPGIGVRLSRRASQATVERTTMTSERPYTTTTTSEVVAITTIGSADSGAVKAANAATILSSMSAAGDSVASSSLAANSPTGSETRTPETATTTSTSSSIIATSTAVPAGYQIPRAFDSTLGTNFTSTACPSFFATFLADPTLQTCAPFSLLLTTSTGFFQAQRSPFGLLPYVLNASCSAPQAECLAAVSVYARTIQLDNTCGPDLKLGNPLATEALQGFQSYELMREVGCARSNATERFCFAEASANTDPSDLYFYYLGEGTTIPSGTTPTCGYCTQNLLGIYARYAANSTLAISRTYASGRSTAALTCGPEFAPAPAIQSTTSAAPRRYVGPGELVAFAAVLVRLAINCA